ncbi:hypothetical protein BVX97_05370 [bacterium E08(2017)]|nr:hypothetical protein BVX97_05370 [bacterium E08(2017)]
MNIVMYISKKHLLLALQLVIGTALLGAESVCGVADSPDPLSILPSEARIDIDGAKLKTGAPTDITFTEPNGHITFASPKNPWDFSRHVAVAIVIENLGSGPVALLGILNHYGWSKGFLHLNKGEKATMHIYLTRKRGEETPWMKVNFNKMRGQPGGYLMFRAGVDPANISTITLSDLDGVSVGKKIRIHEIRGVAQYGTLSKVTEEDFFPFVDSFGQYIHADWPGKVSSPEDLRRNLEEEEAVLANYPGPKDRSRFGGWKEGPKLKASGHFRTTKHHGRWWLVDPDGYLFWSHGLTCVGVTGGATLTEGREHFFKNIPKGFEDGDRVSFGTANQRLKYGNGWKIRSRKHTIRRLDSWGMNTLGNWSHPDTYLMHQVPYVVGIRYNKDPEEIIKQPSLLRANIRQQMQQEIGRTSDDPWCIGYFVDNEIKWTDDMDAEQYYKIVSEEVKSAAPNKLYLGSRFHDHNVPYGEKEYIMRAAARYCDVVGINRYRYSPSDLSMPKGVDVPIIIGEFHFGALDRGLIHTGLRGVVNQEQRSRLYTHYVTQALKHPHIVGAHYFQYREQSITGRRDGENYQIGFVDIADTPYKEMVDAAREVGSRLYQVRNN